MEFSIDLLTDAFRQAKTGKTMGLIFHCLTLLKPKRHTLLQLVYTTLLLMLSTLV